MARRDTLANMEIGLLGTSPAMTQVIRMVTLVANTGSTVLLTGEEGTPKKEVALYIHQLSKRKEGAFVTANLGAIPQGLAESELFGYVKGAFTGAVADREGLVALADRGTLFIEAVDAASQELQVNLLRLLRECEFTQIGSVAARSVDIRVIASTRSPDDFKALRQDLYYRLAVISIEIPPLRNRREDIVALAQSFLSVRGAPRLSSEAAAALRKHSYPGNDRELYSILERAAVFAEGDLIRPKDLALVDLKWEFTQEDIGSLRRELAAARAELTNLERSSIRATPIWEGRRFRSEPDYCFVLMPFAEVRDLQCVYTNHVKKVVEKLCNLRCERADDIADVSGVMQSVWDRVNRARIIIAEMTERNPNVFYELGIAHTLGKPVIMITQSMDYVPSDLKHLRCIVYDYKPGSIDRFEYALEKTIRTVLETTVSDATVRPTTH